VDKLPFPIALGEDRPKPGQGLVGGGIPAVGCPPADLQILEADTARDDGRGGVVAAEVPPGGVDGNDGALAI
jgi:hypothetical protein